MSFKLTVKKQEQTPELANAIQAVEIAVNAYGSALNNLQHAKMNCIGVLCDYKIQFKQRSADADKINSFFNEQGWSKATISQNYAAYRAQQHLIGTGDDTFKEVADTASVGLLTEIGRGYTEDKATAYAVQKHLKETGSLPSVQQAKSFNAGRLNEKFESHYKPDKSDKLNACDEATQNIYQQRTAHMQKLVEDPSYEHITTTSAAQAFMDFTVGDLMCALMQKMTNPTITEFGRPKIAAAVKKFKTVFTPFTYYVNS